MNGKIGIFLTTDIALPYKKDNPLDIVAAERMNIFNINWLLEPLVTGDWPEMMKQAAGSSSWILSCVHLEKKYIICRWVCRICWSQFSCRLVVQLVQMIYFRRLYF